MQNETTEQLAARHDALLDFVAPLVALEVKAEERDRAIAGAMSKVRPQYLEALRAMTGGRLYPDANGTLRVTFGQVEGYAPRDAVWYPRKR